MTITWIPDGPDPSSSVVSRGHFEASFLKTSDDTKMETDMDDQLNLDSNPHEEVSEFLASRIIDGAGEVSRRSAEDFIHVRIEIFQSTKSSLLTEPRF